jgi:hypothetical protein
MISARQQSDIIQVKVDDLHGYHTFSHSASDVRTFVKFLCFISFIRSTDLMCANRNTLQMEVKTAMAHRVNIGDANIDAIFDNILGAPDRTLENIDHQTSDNVYTFTFSVLRISKMFYFLCV